MPMPMVPWWIAEARKREGLPPVPDERLAGCPCEEHDYCDEVCPCRGVLAIKPSLPDPEDPRLTVGPNWGILG